MYYTTIRKGSTRKLTGNFLEKEFHSSSPDAPDSHKLDARLIDVSQLVREVAGVPVYVTSTARFPKDSNYSPSSQHHFEIAAAIDLGAAKEKGEAARVAQLFHREILTHGPVFRQLWELGVRGFGLYDTFMHFDVREDRTGLKSYQAEPYALWDHRSIRQTYSSSSSASGEGIDYGASATSLILNSFKRYEDEEDRSFLRAVLIPVIAGSGLLILFFQIFQRVQAGRRSG